MVFWKGSSGCGVEECGLSSARCHFHPYINRSHSSAHLFAALSHSLPVFLRLTPVNQPSGIIAYITMSWTCDGLKPQRRERWDDCERVNMGRWGQGEGEQNCSGPIAWAFLKTSRDAPINTVWMVGEWRGATRLSLYFSTYLPTYRHI